MIQVKQEALPAAALEGLFKTTSDKVIAFLSLIDKRETKGAKEAKRALVVHSAFASTKGWDYASAIRPKPKKKDDEAPEVSDEPVTLEYTAMGRRQAEEAIEAIKQIVDEPHLTGYGARTLSALMAELEEFAK